MSDAKNKKVVVYQGNGWSLIKTKKSRFLYVVAHDPGKDRLYKSTGTAHIGEAKGIAAALYREYLKEAKREQVKQEQLDQPKVGEDFWAKYIALEEAKKQTGDLDGSTFKRKINAWERVAYYWSSLEPKDFTPQNFILFSADFGKAFPWMLFSK
jgi:hypothetical protein